MISYWNVFRSQSDIELERVQEHCSSCQCPVSVLLVLVRSRTEHNRIRTLITQVSYDMLGYMQIQKEHVAQRHPLLSNRAIYRDNFKSANHNRGRRHSEYIFFSIFFSEDKF